ncbi:hypothetical protein MLD38_029182 [Melastoma candidum]|uniref:Uncharacterized protein n=1 Tax=Melastoma candidum TaxID=119954 RepID=A0ACB9N7C9_9MYRT|nr:hypothetical protein MLD38_029182 [Melastoma candidum]
MRNSNDAISGDLEGGVAVAGTAMSNSLSRRRKKPSASTRFADMGETVMAASKFRKLIGTVHKSEFSRIFQCFNLTRTTTQQKALLLLCVAAAIIDPLFFYIPMINEGAKCMKSDWKIGVFAISLRSVVDILHFVLWSFYYERKWKAWRPKLGASAGAAPVAALKEVSPCSPNSLSPRNSRAIGRLIEILSILPLPQAATLAILIIKGNPRSQQVVTLLKFSVLIQFILRAGFNLLLFVIASHVLGAFWYLLSVGRTMDCWKSACRNRVGCDIDSLYCGGPTDNKSYLDDFCPIQQATNSSSFDFGIYLTALEANIVGSIRFQLKLSYCFWWGLRNLSSMGQNLATSAYEWEICFSICVCILGLILFSLFIGNMQAYFQYRTNEDLMNMKGKMDKIMKKQRDLSNWQPFQWLPPNLKEDVISCVEDNRLETHEVDIQTMLHYLPKDLSGKIKLNILSELRMKVKLFQALNIGALNSMINRLKPEVFPEGSFVFTKDQLIDRMVFIFNGKLTKDTSNDGRTDQELRLWDFCGEELLKEIVNCSSTTQTSSISCPPSTADIRTCVKVEAFVLDMNDLQSLI